MKRCADGDFCGFLERKIPGKPWRAAYIGFVHPRYADAARQAKNGKPSSVPLPSTHNSQTSPSATATDTPGTHYIFDLRPDLEPSFFVDPLANLMDAENEGAPDAHDLERANPFEFGRWTRIVEELKRHGLSPPETRLPPLSFSYDRSRRGNSERIEADRTAEGLPVIDINAKWRKGRLANCASTSTTPTETSLQQDSPPTVYSQDPTSILYDVKFDPGTYLPYTYYVDKLLLSLPRSRIFQSIPREDRRAIFEHFLDEMTEELGRRKVQPLIKRRLKRMFEVSPVWIAHVPPEERSTAQKHAWWRYHEGGDRLLLLESGPHSEIISDDEAKSIAKKREGRHAYEQKRIREGKI